MNPEGQSAYPEGPDRGETSSEERRPYVPPAIIHELELETRAGSPLGLEKDGPYNPVEV